MAMDKLHDHLSNTSTIKKLVGRLRGNSVSTPSTPQRDDGYTSSSSRAPSFCIRTSQISRSPDSHCSSSTKKRGKNGHCARDAQLALELWNDAYDALRDDPSCTGLVIAYENIISQELPGHLKMGGLNSSFHGKPADQRLELLTAITAAGLEKGRSSKNSQADNSAKVVLDAVRDRVASVVAEYHAASVAWAGFCTLTPLLLDPIANQKDFRKGLVHVVGRISWYMHLAELLRANSWGAEHQFREQQYAVRERLVNLYQKVLELEMNCVCATASAWNTAAKNVVGWNTLDKVVKDLLDMDAQVVEIVEKHCAERTRETLLQEYLDLDMSWTTGAEVIVESTTSHPMQMAQVVG
ncbi:hypothetical protein VB005_05183 [Metarhizium brunneum]